MIEKLHMKDIVLALLCLFLFSGCASPQEREDVLSSVKTQETTESEREYYEISAVEEDMMIDNIMTESDLSETVQEIPTEENGLLELYADGDKISVSEELMIAHVLPEEILKGNPVLYNRFRTDGWVFEWLISDYHDNGDYSLEDAVIVASREDDAANMQIIHVKAEGGYGTWVSAENKFEYVDVNFDNIPDLLICTGHHGNQGLLTYYCFLQLGDGFTEAPTFTEIPNPAIDAQHQLILSQWRNSAASHSWAEYQCQDNTYVLYRELCEDAVWDSERGEDIWVWTINGEEIGRSDVLSEEEIYHLLYDENGEWGIAGDRWRTLYNDGLIVDYSIYNGF